MRKYIRPLPQAVPTSTRMARLELPEYNENVAALKAAILSSLAAQSRWQRDDNGTAKKIAQAWMKVVDTVTLLDFCAEVLTCINTDQQVIEALQQVTNTETIINNTNYSSQTIITGNADNNGCGNDAKFGRIVALIDYIDEVQSDFFESIDAATNVIGQISQIISAIPIFETLPFDELVSAIGNTGELWRDSYDGSVNTQLKESFACDLWCAYGDDCDITVRNVLDEIIRRYDISSTTGALNALNLSTLIARIAITIAQAGGLAYIGDDFVYLSWGLQLAAIELTATFFGVDPIDYARESSNGSPNNGWTQCEPCDNCIFYDFTESDADWTIYQLPPPDNRILGSYISGEGFRDNTAIANDNCAIYSLVLNEDIKSVEVNFNQIFTGGNPAVFLKSNVGGSTIDDIISSKQTYLFTGIPAGTRQVTIQADPDFQATGNGWQSQRLTSIKVCF